MTFHPHFAKLSTLKGYFSGFIGGTGILFLYNFPQVSRLSFGIKNFTKFSAEELLAKIIENNLTFCRYFSNISRLIPQFSRFTDGAGLFLTYIVPQQPKLPFP